MDILKKSQEFLKEVMVLKDNVFSDKGLLNLKIKNDIRELTLKLRNFSAADDED